MLGSRPALLPLLLLRRRRRPPLLLLLCWQRLAQHQQGVSRS
jgi:hypothetical protein